MPDSTQQQRKQRWQFHWQHLQHEVVSTNTCTGCAGCIVACPHDVLSYDDHWHPVLAAEARVEGAVDRCVHGEKACTMCTRACPRFRGWEPEADTYLFGRERRTTQKEIIGIHRDILLVRTTHDAWLERGQDGGLCSAMLIWALRRGHIDAALVNYVDDRWNTTPGVARTEEDVLRAAGSRYTYSANTLAYQEAVDAGAEKLALVGMGCMASVPAMMMVRGARKPGKKFALTIGLLCSKSFTDDIFEGLLEPRYGLARDDIVKMNIKGKLQLWTRPGAVDGDYVEVPLSECHEYTRPGCNTCPDFAAEHADVSMGGLGQSGGWTLTVIRTEEGRKIFDEMVDEGWLEVRSAVDEDPGAVALMRKLAAKSRKRWPVHLRSGRPVEDAIPGVVEATLPKDPGPAPA